MEFNTSALSLMKTDDEDSFDQLDQILHTTCNIAILKRTCSPAPEAILELVNSSFQSLQFVFDREQPIELMGAYFDEHLNLKSQDAFLFCSDIMKITKKFMQLCKDKFIGVRLERVTNDNCKAFHVDYLSLRLICTYHGPATEWLENSNVNRTALGKNRNDLVCKNLNEIRRFKTNWIGILKGENFDGNNGHGVVHRSPQISDLSSKPDRILLRIDTLERFGSNT